ncbi:MAG TPA: CBS domain-containing protein [Planctomycetota bacterium]|nr:CBS domain-containing protein [Planctomycetota bacterium]
MKVEQVMTRDPQVVEKKTPLREAAEKMRELDVGFLPVVDDGRCVGVVTDRDITVRVTAEGRDPGRARVEEAMTPSFISCRPGDDLARAEELMQRNQVRRLLVMGEREDLVGVVSLGDVALKDSSAGGEVLKDVSKPS